MKRSKLLKCIRPVSLVIAAVILLCWTGKMDYNEEIIYNMPQVAYDMIADSLGQGCSDSQIVKAYMDNKEYYDSLNW